MTDAKESFHNRHEALTELVFNSPGMLPDRYVFVLTNMCNLKCSFCFQDKKRRSGSMTADDWIRLTQQLPEYARVTITGGEPLLFLGFKDVFSFVASRHDCNMITNGVLLTEEIIDFLLSFSKFRVLSVSVDSVKNRVRGVDEAQWVHAEQMMRYFILRRNMVHSECVLDIKTTVLDENAGDLLAIHKYCVEDLACDHHAFQFLKGSPLQHADVMHPLEDVLGKSKAPVYSHFDLIKRELERVRNYNVERGTTAFVHPKVCFLKTTDPNPDIDYLNIADHVKENYQPCKFPWSSVHVNMDGHLFPCVAVSMGNVKSEPLRDVIQGEAFYKFRDLIKRQGTVEGCNRCGWLRPRSNLLGSQRE